jgi:hypothetical protein
MLDRIPSMRSDATMEKAALDRVKSRLRSVKSTKRSFKMEIRLVQDVGQRRIVNCASEKGIYVMFCTVYARKHQQHTHKQ